MSRPPKKPWSEMTLEEKETRAMGCALVSIVLARLNSRILSDIADHCEDWCMVPDSCPPSCPLYKYIKAFKENDVQNNSTI